MKPAAAGQTMVALGRRKPRLAVDFTLVEVLCAIVVAAIIIAAAVSLINVVNWGMVQSQRTSRAVAIANSRIEQLQAGDFADLDDRFEIDRRVNAQGVPSSDGLYRRSTRVIKDNPDSDSTREVEVEVTVPWRPGKSEIEVSLTTIIVDSGLFLEGF